MSLNAKQERFVAEYLVDLNATQAAIRSGYSEATAYSQGQRLLKHVEVEAAIETAMEKRAERTGITQDMVLSELAKIGFVDIRKAVQWFSSVAVAAADERSVDDIIEDGPSGEVRHQITNQVELVSSAEIDDATAAAIAEISMTDKGGLKVKLHDKRAALVDIGRHLGMFKDRIEHSGPGGVPLGISVTFVEAKHGADG